MFDNIIRAALGSVISVTLTSVSIKTLSPYTITDLDNIFTVMFNAYSAFDSPAKLGLILCILGSTASAVMSVFIIMYLVGLFEEPVSGLQKVGIIVWIMLLVLSILVTVYHLLFLILMIILSMVIIIALLTGVSNSRGFGGPVHVRGHFRKGSYVRSHTRSRPRRF